MADITKCYGLGCNVKDDCYRHTAPVNEWRQSYFMEVPGKDESCEHYWNRE